MKNIYFLFLILGQVLALFSSAAPLHPADTLPNILVIIADDMSLNAGIYGDRAISTPGIDSVGKDGIVFENAFCTASSCSPSRASILTGRFPHQLKEGGNLWGFLPVTYPTYTRILSKKGYAVGLTGKGWGPGNFQAGGYKQNPAGPNYKDFDHFLAQLPARTPFCYWIGSHDPHRPYDPELKETAALNESELKVPSWLPDNDTVRADLLDYLAEVKRFDQRVEHAIATLKEKGLYDNTLIIITSDNGRPFPRAKANCYDGSSRIPLVMRWGNHFKNGSRYPELISLVNIAPTLLAAAGVDAPSSMSGRSLLPLLMGGKGEEHFQHVFIERERHANVRKNNLGYPTRAVRTKEFLYVHNLRPERWPAGDPERPGASIGFGDIDNGPAKMFLVHNRFNPQFKQQAAWSLEKRPEEELYELKTDPDQLHNIAMDPAYASVKNKLKATLLSWQKQTGDPLLKDGRDIFDSYPYFGGRGKKKK